VLADVSVTQIFLRPRRAIAAAQGLVMKAQQKPAVPVIPGRRPQDPRMGVANAEKLFKYSTQRAKVSIIKGENRRKNVFRCAGRNRRPDPARSKKKKYVLINPTAATHRGGADFPRKPTRYTESWTTWLPASRVKWWWRMLRHGGPRRPPASSAGQVFAEHKAFNMILRLPNQLANRYELLYGIDYDMHPVPSVWALGL